MCWWLRDGSGAAVGSVERYGHWTALVVLLGVGLLLIVDLGRPERFPLMLTRFDNLGSPIAVGAKLIALKTFLLLVVLYSLERRRTAPPAAGAQGPGIARLLVSWVPWLLVMTSVALAVYPASVLARSWASPLAATSGSSLLFLLTALLMGAAATALILSGVERADRSPELLHRNRQAMLVLLALFGTVLVFQALSMGGDPPERRILAEVVSGGLAATFWGLVIVVGTALPVACLSLYPARRAAFVVSAAAIMTGAAATRYLLFAAGQ
jgi:formate-dependent nitrite reductase membrane component NrfD